MFAFVATVVHGQRALFAVALLLVVYEWWLFCLLRNVCIAMSVWNVYCSAMIVGICNGVKREPLVALTGVWGCI